MDEYDELLARVRSGPPAAPAVPAGAPKVDEYDQLLKQVRTPDLTSAQSAIYNGSFSNPAQEAEKRNLSANIKKMLGEDIAPSIIDPVEDSRRVRQAQMDHGIQQSASLRKWIENDPGNAGLVGTKDVAPLLSVDGALHAGRRAAGSMAAGFAADTSASAYTYAAMPFKLGEQGLEALGMPPWMAQTEMGKALLWAARESKKTGDVASGARGDEGNVEAGVYSGFRSLGGNLLTMGTGSALNFGAKITTGIMAAIAGGGSALKAFDSGKSATTALTLAGADAAAEFATEAPGMKQLFAIPGLKQGMMAFAKGAGNFAVKEMAGEQLATVWQDFNEWALINPEKTLDDFIAERPDAAIQTAVATLVGGGGQIAIQQAMVRGRQQETKALFDALHQGAQDSELLKNVPEKYREFVKQATADGGVETVFIPAEKFTTYFQGRDMDPAMIAKELGASNYTEAMAAGSDVMIPMDAFATLIAGTDHYAGLQNDLRLHQGDLTASEQAIADANQDATIEKMQADIEAIAAQNDQGLNAQIARIQDDIALQLSPRFDKQTADTYAQVMRGIAVATARDTQNKAKAEGREASEGEIQRDISAQLAKYDIKINPNPPLPEILTKRPNFKAEIDPMLDMLRAGKGVKEQDIFGKSLVEFIRERGGLAPVGELQDVGTFDAKLIQELGAKLDDMAMKAVEAGYFPGTEDGQLTETQLVEAILNELAGDRKEFATQNDKLLDQQATLEGLQKALDAMGLDINAMDNEAIKAALFPEATFEQGQNRINQDDLDKFAENLKTETGLERLTLIDIGDNEVELSAIIVPKGQRGSGAGTAAMNRIIEFADENGLRIMLDPASRGDPFMPGTTSQARLVKFYKRFGFTDNKGRKRDFSISYGMYREPQKVGTGDTAMREVDIEDRHDESGYPLPEFEVTVPDDLAQRMLSAYNKSADKSETKLGRVEDSEEIGAKTDAFKVMAEAEGYTVGGDRKYLTLSKRNGPILHVRLSDHANVNKGVHFGESLINIAPGDGSNPVDTFGSALFILRNAVVDENGDTIFIREDARILYQPAYHGSPFKFDRFTLDHIGKGEGAQAYGWGLYFAGKKEIGEFYRDQLKPNSEVTNWQFGSAILMRNGEYQDYSPRDSSPLQQAKAVLSEDLLIREADILNAYDKDGIEAARAIMLEVADDRITSAQEDNPGIVSHLKILRKRIAEELKFDVKVETGQLYEVEIPEDGQYLLWDKPLSEQPEKVKAATSDVLQVIKNPVPAFSDETWLVGFESDNMDDVVDAYATKKEAMAAREQMTGRQLYEALAPGRGPRAASMFLQERGIVGIKYLDGSSRDKGEGSFNYVIFDENAVKVLQTFYQPENRGQIRIGAERKINIDLLKGANFSTFLHETGHFYLEFLGDLAENGSAETKADYAAILKWMGVTSRDQIEVKHHEMFARANERYLMEGKAPSIELRSAFARFKGWLTSIYKTLTALDVKLTDEVREVFDRIYATDAEIAAARAENDLVDVFVTAEQMGVSQAEFDAYKKQAGKEIVAGYDKLRAKVMRVQRLKREQWWRDELAKTRTEVAAEIDGLKSYQAHDTLTAKDSELKIDRTALVEQYGEPILKRLPRGFGEGRGAIYTGKDQSGVSVGTAAQLLGYDSADALIEDMANLKPRNKLIAAEADARMNERYGDILNSIELADEAQEALHNSERGSKLAMELKALRSLQRKVDPILKARAKDQAADEKIGRQHSLDVAPVSVFREAARRVMATKLIRDIRPNDYLVAERKANRRAFEAMGKKDYGAAQEAKQQELLNFALYQEATRVKAEMKKLHDFAARFEKGPMREKLGKAGEQYLEAATAILEDVELRNKSLKAIDRTKLMNWLKEAENSDLYVTEDMIAGTYAKNWKDLTVEEMRTISDALKNIEHVASRQLKIMVGQKMMDFKETVDGISASIIEHGGKAKPVSMEPEGKFIRFVRGFNAQNRKISSLVRQMDGGVENGPFYNAFVRSMNERGAWESDKNSEATKALAEIYAPILKMKGGITGDVRMIPGLGASLSRGARLSIALNWGNEGNRQRILGSDYGNGMLTPMQVNAVLDTLTREEWTFVNQTWKFINDFWPEIAAKEKRVYGVAPEKVEAAPFTRTFADGSTIALTGGYYPIKYDQSKDDKAAAHDQATLAQEVMRGAFTAQTTRKGHTEARVEEVKRPVRLSLDVITEHVAQVTHDLAWHEWLIDATRIMRSRKISSAIRDHYGDAVLKTMRDGLTGIAVGDLANQTATDTALMYLRANVQRSTMGFSLTTAFLQPFGLTQSMARIGPKYVLRGIAEWTGDMAHFENTLKKIREKSVFMKHRGETFNRELHEIKGRVTGNQSKARQIYDASLFMLMQKMQTVADVPTWLGAYDKATESGNTEEEAIAQADRAVLESQGGGQTKDLTEFQRKHPMLTVFFSYFSVTYNLMAESTAKTSFKNPMSMAGWVSDMMLLAVIPALGPAIILSLLRGEGGDDDEEKWMAKLAKWQAAYLIGTLPLVREAGGSIEGYGYAGPPAGRIVSDTAKLGSQVVKVWNDEADATDEQPVLAAVRFLGSFLGIPTVQAIRTYKGWKAWDDGEAPATAILVGPPRAEK